MERQNLAYLLIIFMGIALAALIMFRTYHSRSKTLRRAGRKENAEYERLMAAKADLSGTAD